MTSPLFSSLSQFPGDKDYNSYDLSHSSFCFRSYWRVLRLGHRFFKPTPCHGLPSVLLTLIHPIPFPLTFHATPNRWLAHQGPFSGVLHLRFSSHHLPMCPTAGVKQIKVQLLLCLLLAVSCLADFFTAELNFFFFFFLIFNVSEVRKHLIFRVIENYQPQN